MKQRANYDVGTIENTIEVETRQAIASLNELTSSLKSLKSTVESTIGSFKNNPIKQSLQETTSKADAFKKALGMGAIIVGFKKVFDITKQVSNAYISMIETNNLFEVSLGKVVDEYGKLDEEASKYYIKALAIQDKMNEKLATNKTELMQYQAMYYSMFKSQGINKDASYLMSESLTKAGYDIASLYNLETSQAVEKLRAGIAGQVEPLRAIGIDISESALSRVLDDVGIERSVQQLSYAEKEVARYIAIIQQAGQAQGDFARTFEQPANQLRIFKNQLQELSQVAGAFVVNAFGGIITWANGVIMAIKEVLKAIASLFGWDLSSSGSSLENVSGSINDIETGIGGATKKAKEFKKQLMGFDEINNINLPEENKGSGSGGVSGIDNKLLDSLKEWDNKMESVRGKAQQIRNNILEWLGFTKDVNGNLTWAWKNMDIIAKAITIIGGIIAGITIVGTITKIVNWISKLVSIFNTGKGGITTFGLGLQTLGKGFGAVKAFIGTGIDQFIIYKNAGMGVFSALGKTISELVTLISPVVKIFGGMASAIGGAILYFQGLKDIVQKTTEPLKAFFKVISGIILIATGIGVVVGSVMAGAVAGIVALVTALVVAVVTYWEEIKKFFTETIPQAISNFKIWLDKKWNDFTTWLGTLPAKIGYGLGFIAGKVVQFFVITIPEAWAKFKSWKDQKWKDFTTWLSGLPAVIWEGLVKIEAKLVTFFTVTIPEAWAKLIAFVKELPANFLEFGKNVIQGLIDGIKNKYIALKTVVTDFVNGFVTGFKNALGIHSPSTIFNNIGVNLIQGLINGITSMAHNVWSTITGLAGNVVTWFKEKLGIHSPSVIMKNFIGKFIPLGIAEGIDENSHIVFASLKKISEGIKINAKDFSVDTNAFVDYGQIRGNIKAMSDVELNGSIFDDMAMRIVDAINTQRIEVEVNARTDKGTIVETAVNGIQEYTNRTGNLPFTVPV